MILIEIEIGRKQQLHILDTRPGVQLGQAQELFLDIVFAKIRKKKKGMLTYDQNLTF